MINMEAAKHTVKVVGTGIGIISSVFLYFWFLGTYFGIYGFMFGGLFITICLISRVIYEFKKQEIEYKKRFNR